MFLQVASKFDARYPTLGFEDSAQLDGGYVADELRGVTA